MQYAIDGKQMRALDDITVKEIGIPSCVLMEKAAMAVVLHAEELFDYSDKIVAICGCGNNGGDGVAAARILFLKGYHVCIYMVGDKEKMTKETRLQLRIARKSGVKILRKLDFLAYTGIIDAVFGLGLSRNITGELRKLIEGINGSGAKIISVDVPSGVCADDGKVLGIAVNADMTVTFGYMKVGCLLFPGAEHAGKTYVEDIGITRQIQRVEPKKFYFDEAPETLLIPRKKNSNKGTYGKVLVIAGQKDMSGAAYFSAAAAYKTGAGIVRVLTDISNREVLQRQLPEAILSTVDTCGKKMEEKDIETIKEAVAWASVVVIGPGLGTGPASVAIVNYVIANCSVPLLIDADGINILSKIIGEKTKGVSEPKERVKILSKLLPAGTILTPHKKELSELTGIALKDLVNCLMDASAFCTYGNELIFVKKDVHTIVSFSDSDYINVTGNDGMATAGSGDVLSGIIAGLLAQGELPKMAAMIGCYVHGAAGNVAAERKGVRSMIASDILDGIPAILKKRGY